MYPVWAPTPFRSSSMGRAKTVGNITPRTAPRKGANSALRRSPLNSIVAKCTTRGSRAVHCLLHYCILNNQGMTGLEWLKEILTGDLTSCVPLTSVIGLLDLAPIPVFFAVLRQQVWLASFLNQRNLDLYRTSTNGGRKLSSDSEVCEGNLAQLRPAVFRLVRKTAMNIFNFLEKFFVVTQYPAKHLHPYAVRFLPGLMQLLQLIYSLLFFYCNLHMPPFLNSSSPAFLIIFWFFF